MRQSDSRFQAISIGAKSSVGIASGKRIFLRNNLDYQRSQLTELSETTFARWTSVESFKLAPQVYRGLQSGSKTDGKALPDDYADTAKPIPQRDALRTPNGG